ncbi:hypothetical protein [Altererythrobacter sp. CC-YST694]|uniref:hypothetical protein n=1 Tax=Altererythrobacter sp. CC-YST694 TaxID=2755038 RepID=UPI001D0337E5|nr:hypothetical protein [Altererythrobacter sp. CC-YST694]
MDGLIPYLILFGIVFGVNLMPAFGPPTWSIIVLYGLNSDLPVPAIILVGALAAASGRFLLAHAFRLLGRHVSEKTRANLAAAREAFERNRKGGIAALGLFALSPLPSAQLFEAAGLAGMRLAGFTAAFFAGRIVSYSIYAFSAKEVRQSSFGDLLAANLSSPLGIALQLAMIAALVALARLDWAKLLARGKGS